MKQYIDILVLNLDFNATSGNVVKEASGYANNGYLMAGAILVNFPKSKCGNAAYTYCGDILFHGDTFQAKPYEAVSIAAWINLKETAGSHSIFDTIGSTHTYGQYHFEVNNGMIRWFHRNASQTTVFSNTAEGDMVKKDTWTHVVGTYDSASGKSKIYVNGMLRNMTIGGGLLSRDWVSRAGIGDHKASRPLMGFIDDFRIYNYALARADIVKLVNKCGLLPKRNGYNFFSSSKIVKETSCSPICARREFSITIRERLVLNLAFDNTQGNVVLDSSGYANNGYLMAGAILVNFPKSKCGNAAYTYNGDILFHGETFQAKPYEGVSIAAWINLKETAGSHSIFDTTGSTHTSGQYHFEVNNGIIRWFHRNKNQTTVFSNTALKKKWLRKVRCTFFLKANTWTHVVGTYDSASGKSKIYVNGMLRNMTIGGGLLSRDWVSRAGIGDHKASRPLMGFIDDFRIYNYALTRADIVKLVNKCGLLPKCK
ncbi:hypothetical protein QZH41_014817 [Actinostola sp. cb2023]|nr:hypothetical protein QZH41_014817 [Actinostola sp. cb2023]